MCGSSWFGSSARCFLLAAITAACIATVTAVGVVVFFLLFRFLFVFRLQRLFLFLGTCRLPTIRTLLSFSRCTMAVTRHTIVRMPVAFLARPIITAVYHFMTMYRQCTIDLVRTVAVVYVGTAAVVFDGNAGTAGIVYAKGGELLKIN
jgi:hypothetical protein